MARHVEAILAMQSAGSIAVDYGNNLRAQAADAGVPVKNPDGSFEYPGFVPAYIRPLFCEGKGPFRWVALSGDPKDIYKTDRALKELFPERPIAQTLGRSGARNNSDSQACPRGSAGSVTANGRSPV
ncbi:MAG: hypothetical protein MPW15_26500 [Candidatus Manganitrophus sp.]|nr:hypothetical protein [Candidatus Manganitrophus sp.]